MLLGVWLAVGERAPEAPFAWERLDLPAPDALAVGDGTVIVHFWATWCAPCRTELPVLLEVAAEEGARLLAATDDSEVAIARFFPDGVPPAIVRDPRGIARDRYRVSGLPDTFVVIDGRIVARVGGPRDWRSAEGRRFLRGERR